MSDGTGTEVSVVVLNHNGADVLPACLESLLGQDLPGAMEVIVADNASTDDSASVAARYHGVRFLATGGNLGFSRGNNRGAATAQGRYLFFVNNDMRFDPSCIRLLWETLEEQGDAFAADARQMSWDGEKMIHGLTVLRPASLWWYQYPRIRFDPLATSDQVVETPLANGANLFCRRRMFEELGGFDETFFLDFEDLDLCWRAWLRGWKSLYVPGAWCLHKVGFDSDRKDSGSDDAFRTFREASYIRNQIRFTWKCMPFRDCVLVFVRQLVLWARYLVQGRFASAGAIVRALADNLVNLSGTLERRREIMRHAVTDSRSLFRRFMVETVQAPVPT